MDLDYGLKKELNKIVDSNPSLPRYVIKAILTVNEKDNYPINFPMTLDSNQDFAGKLSEELILKGQMLAGNYLYKIYPNKDKLTCTLNISASVALNEDTNTTMVYDAILIDDRNKKTELNEHGSPSEDDLNKYNLADVEIQLIPKAINDIRKIKVGTVIRQASNNQIMKSILSKEVLTLSNEKLKGIESVDIVKTDNEEVQIQTIIPQDTSLAELPYLLQNKNSGVYLNGISSYIHRGKWSIFPTYEFGDEAKMNYKRITAIFVDKKIINDLRNTWCVDGDTLKIIVSGSLNQSDDSTTIEGNTGTMLAKPNNGKMMEEDGYIAKRQVDKIGIDTEKSYNLIGYPGSLNNSTFIQPLLDNNVNDFSLSSSISAKRGGKAFIEWNCCVANFIEPNTVIELYYETDGKVVHTIGKILKISYFYNKISPGLVDVPFEATAGIEVYLTQADEDTSKSDDTVSAIGISGALKKVAYSVKDIPKVNVKMIKDAVKLPINRLFKLDKI